MIRPLVLQNHEGLVLWKREGIALLREEYDGRVEGTSSWGEVAHCPGPLKIEPPWVEVAPGVLAHPRHARRAGGELVFPGGTRVKSAVELPRPAARPPDPLVKGCKFRVSEVLYLRNDDEGSAWWHTDQGRVPAGTDSFRAAKRHPHLLRAGHIWVNVMRLRAITSEKAAWRLVLDNSEELSMSKQIDGSFAESLGLKRLDRVEPFRDSWEPLFELGLRDFPQEIFHMEPATLKGHFGQDERLLMASVLWQTFRILGKGATLPYGTDNRAFWYFPLFVILTRAGIARAAYAEADIDEFPPDLNWLGRGENTLPQYRRFERLVTTMVGEHRLFTYRQLGYEDPRPDLRCIGHTRPDIVVLVEKTTLRRGARALSKTCGVTTIIMAGTSNYFATELLVEELRAAGVTGPVTVVAYVDFDPSGWFGADAFVRHLARYDVQVSKLGFLIRPQRFTAEERALIALPLAPVSTQEPEETAVAWVERSGGVDGLPLAIHADHLWPDARIVEAFEQELAAMS